MSNARPMPAETQVHNFVWTPGQPVRRATARQARAIRRKANREQNTTSQASGVRVRRPVAVDGRRLPRHTVPLRGSIVRYVAMYCRPCVAHRTPRLHAVPISRVLAAARAEAAR